VIISLILKFDTSKFYNGIDAVEPKLNTSQDSESFDSYVYSMERKIEEMIKQINGINSVKVMLYTQNTPKLEPVYDENTTSETNIEIGSDGIKREIKRDTKQNQVVMGSNNQVAEKYYQYPEITGVLVVVDYSGDKNINSILMNSVKTLFNIKVNDIEIIKAN
jgi:stage III sporulation protein AG